MYLGLASSRKEEIPATSIEAPGVDESLLIGSELAQIHFEKGDELYEDSRWEEALEEYHEARKLDPARAVVYDKLGMVYYYLGEYEEAKAHLEKYIELDTEMTERMVNQVRLFILKFEEEELSDK